MSLEIKMLPDDATGLEDKDVLIEALRANASNLGYLRCLCSSCLCAWALNHFVENPGAAWDVESGRIARKI